MRPEQLFFRSALYLLVGTTLASLIPLRPPDGATGKGGWGEADRTQGHAAIIGSAFNITSDTISGTSLFTRNYCDCSSSLDQHAVDAAVLDLIQRSSRQSTSSHGLN